MGSSVVVANHHVEHFLLVTLVGERFQILIIKFLPSLVESLYHRCFSVSFAREVVDTILIQERSKPLVEELGPLVCLKFVRKVAPVAEY